MHTKLIQADLRVEVKGAPGFTIIEKPELLTIKFDAGKLIRTSDQNARCIRRSLNQVIADSNGKVIIDLKKITQLDSGMIGMLVGVIWSDNPRKPISIDIAGNERLVDLFDLLSLGTLVEKAPQ